MRLQVDVEKWPLKTPFRITGYEWLESAVVVVTLSDAGLSGRGEAAGVYYLHDDVAAMLAQIERVRRRVEAGIDRDTLQRALPAGGARNALDCALWELDAKRAGKPVWQLAGLDAPKPMITAHTVGANPPEVMAAAARTYDEARLIKLKLTGEGADAERVLAVRQARPDVTLIVDANQGFTRESLLNLLPHLVEARVTLIEQPFKTGEEALLDGMRLPIAVGADESAQTLDDIPRLIGRFDVFNIKLDKCGGLTEALSIAREARRQGLKLMVGNMTGTSLAMAPGFVVAQLCQIVDLDGPMFLKSDRHPAVVYHDGAIRCPDDLWGGSAVDGESHQ
jgi:L-alanine-DL-glutamate epimerase-like enolase superfamily enzyme